MELGNGDKFIFDIGTGSAERLSALKIPYDYLDMVFNVTKDDIKVRMAAIDEDIWPQKGTQRPLPADLSQRAGFSDFIISGRIPYADVVKEMYDEVNEKYGTDIKPPAK